jgi:predicted Zn-dependent peptidase
MVVIVGDTDGSVLVSRVFSEGLRRGELDKTLKANLPLSEFSPEEKIDQRVRQATAVAAGFRVTAQKFERQNDVHALKMLAMLASTGKVVEELRDKLTLAESALVVFEQRLASGAFFAQTAALPQNEKQVVEALLATMQGLASAQPTDEEFEQGRNGEIGRYAVALQDNNLRAMEYARAGIFGRNPSDVESQPDLMREIKKTDIKRLAESVIKTNLAGRGIVRAGK